MSYEEDFGDRVTRELLETYKKPKGCNRRVSKNGTVTISCRKNVSNRTKKNQVVPIVSNSLNIPSDTLESYKNVK